MTKLCETCQHFQWEQSVMGRGACATRALCGVLVGAPGLVSDKRVVLADCHAMRFGGPCGQDGKLWQKRCAAFWWALRVWSAT